MTKTKPPNTSSLGTLSPEEDTFLVTLKTCSVFSWQMIKTRHLQEFPSGKDPKLNDYRSRYCRGALKMHPVKVCLEGQQPLAAADRPLVIDFLRRYVPDGYLSECGRALVGFLPDAGNAALSGASLSHDSVPQAAAPPPSPAPSTPPVQQYPQERDPMTGEPFGWVSSARDPGPVVQEEQGLDDVEMEPSADEEEPEPLVESIYPDPTLYELAIDPSRRHPARFLQAWGLP